LALHLANTLLLLASLTLTAHLLSRRKGYLRGSVRLVAPFGAAACIFVMMIVGVTGSLAALGDTLFPASSLGQALNQDFSPTSGWLVHWRWMHPAVAFVASIFLIWLLFYAAQRPAGRTQGKSGTGAGHWDTRRLSAQVLVLLASVYTLGVLDVVLLAPLWVQVAHLLGADTLWASLVVLTARLTVVPVETGRRE
jgi:cytochrome c oxidase assembly protein subunit 15